MGMAERHKITTRPYPPGVWFGWNKSKLGFWLEVEDSDRSPGLYTVEVLPGAIVIIDDAGKRSWEPDRVAKHMHIMMGDPVDRSNVF